MSTISKDFWPGALAHLSEPLIGPADEYVSIARVSNEPVVSEYSISLKTEELTCAAWSSSRAAFRGASGCYDGDMRLALDPFRLLLISLAGFLNQRQQDVIEYLHEENRVLREQ